jgi:hypothetical protein
VRGEIVRALTVQDFASPKGKPTRLHSFLVRVTEVLDEYEDCATRARQWVSVPEAARLVERSEMQAMLEAAMPFLTV